MVAASVGSYPLTQFKKPLHLVQRRGTREGRTWCSEVSTKLKLGPGLHHLILLNPQFLIQKTGWGGGGGRSHPFHCRDDQRNTEERCKGDYRTTHAFKVFTHKLGCQWLNEEAAHTAFTASRQHSLRFWAQVYNPKRFLSYV